MTDGCREARVALVTGAAAGLGRAIAEVLCDKGFRCSLLDCRRDVLAAAALEISRRGQVECSVGDVTIAADRDQAVKATLDAFGRVDVLVNNAGISHAEPLLATKPSDWLPVMATNVEAMFFLSQAVIGPMRSQGYGRIINIGSVYGSLGLNGALYASMLAEDTADGPVRQVAYHASKGAVLNMTRELAAAVGRWGITVNSVSPGMFLTEQSRAVANEAVTGALTKLTPLGRMGVPPEVGYAVAFLASDEASFITGVDLRVDGGWSIW
ncbi:MAG: SDR family oxidoreductase [Acidimicrobiales bacterium]|jgi:NAD(P)-dependent dehydrogenase (short-subunit alcohol dehydrogenase family)